MLGEHPLQDGDDPPGAERGPDLDRQALPREFIDQREDAQRLPVGAMILEEVIGPDVIRAFGSDRNRVPGAATPSSSATRPGQAQAQLLPQAVDPLEVDGPSLAPQHRPGPAIAVLGVPSGQLPQPLAEGLVPVLARAVSQAGAAEVQQSAG